MQSIGEADAATNDPGDRLEPIERSLITSCSPWRLGDLICEVRSVSGVSLVDLFILRDADIEDIDLFEKGVEKGRSLKPGLDPGESLDTRTSTKILAADDENLDLIEDWVRAEFAGCNRAERRAGAEKAGIAALATYFPAITAHLPTGDNASHVPDPRADFRDATSAIANTVRLALRLKKDRRHPKSGAEEPALMRHAVVEIVCGTTLDRCACLACQNTPPPGHSGPVSERGFETKRELKLQLLCDRLLDVVKLVNNSEEGADAAWVLALELEPGRTYVFNDNEAIQTLLNLLKDDKYVALRPHVGLNVDIAHMRIAGVQAEDLRPLSDWIVHAHICDHPGMHTRDQVVGSWTPVERYESEFYPYLRLLAEIDPQSPERAGRPFTGAVALELEGCGRINWIHQSLVAMKRMVEVVKHHCQRIPL